MKKLLLLLPLTLFIGCGEPIRDVTMETMLKRQQVLVALVAHQEKIIEAGEDLALTQDYAITQLKILLTECQHNK